MAYRTSTPTAFQRIGGTPDSIRSLADYVFSELDSLKSLAFQNAREAQDFDAMLDQLQPVASLQNGIASALHTAQRRVQQLHEMMRDQTPQYARR